jgi:hypothetical protein
LKSIPNLILLGNPGLEKLPIFSFMIKHEQSGYYLHHNFVTALLNDLFGIQSRSGCAVALKVKNNTLDANLCLHFS